MVVGARWALSEFVRIKTVKKVESFISFIFCKIAKVCADDFVLP